MAYFSVIFCLDSQPGLSRADIKRILNQATSALMDYMSIQMYTAVGQKVDSLRQISISYRQAQRYVHGLTPDNPVVFYEAPPDDAVAYVTQVQEIRRGIRKAFEELDPDSLDDALGRIADTFEQHPDDLLQAMDTTCNILYMAISLLPEGESLLEGIFSGSPDGYRALYQMRDTASIASWVRQLRDGCLEQLHSHRQSYNEHVVAGVKAYIHENIGKCLSLQEVAAVFNFNPNYLSGLFSKYAGSGYIEYITAVRIDAAKKLLVQGQLRVYEIAERLGFESSFYFSKVFKKAEGLSPREYINKNRDA
jgi:two-component system response regulator YesN